MRWSARLVLARFKQSSVVAQSRLVPGGNFNGNNPLWIGLDQKIWKPALFM